MAPSSLSIADSQSSSTAPGVAENDLQPFFVLHKASSRRKDRTSTEQGKLRKRDELSSSPPPQSAKKLAGRTTEECDHHLFQQLQIETFEIVWAKIESTIKDVLRDLNASVFNDIQQWVLECFNATTLLGEPSIAEATRSFPVLNDTTPGQLFTALVITRNMEFVDDIWTFEELGDFLKSHGCHVAMLSSPEFSLKNGISGCLKALLRELLGDAIDSADISILASWYREQDNYNKPLVLIINDLERCCGSVLTDFILMLSEWVVKVPIILIFGVATTVDTPRNILPSYALGNLCPSKFMFRTPAERMDAIVEAVLVKHCTTFSIGHKVALFLRNYFINQDGTVTSFIRALKVACLLYFSMEPLSLIHGQILAEDQKEGKSTLSPETMLKYMDELPFYASEWVVKVPIILIFGVATTVDTPRNILPSYALGNLCPSKFMFRTPAERMDAIVEAVLVKHCTTFSIGHKVALFLRNYFINQDGTVTSFIRALKVACLLYFSMEPLSLIHGQILAEDQKEGKSTLSPETMLKYMDELPFYASEWVVKVPIILIFGVATTVDTPRNILPSYALGNLCPSKFMFRTPAERMDAIVEAVLVKHCTTFSIGHKVALFLRNYFINQDGTVTSFIRALKVACLLYFSMEPLSLIHGQILAEDQKEGKSTLSPETMLKYMDELPFYARNQMVDQTRKSMAEGLSELVTVQKLWSTVVLCLYEAGKYSRVRLLDLFCEALDQDLYPSRDSGYHVGDEKDHGLSMTDDPCQQYSIMQSGGFVCQIVRKVRDLPTGMLYQLIESWEKLTADIPEIHQKLEMLQSSVRCKDGKSSRKSSKDISKRYSSRVSVNIDKDSRGLNSQAITFLDCLVRNFLKPIEGMPFHEIFCFKNVEKLQLVLIGDPRRRIQVDLLEFHKILRCTCCNKSGNALLPSRHDSSIMYSLAQEHGDLINLHDWFQSFRTIVLQHTNKRKQKSRQPPLPKKRKDTNGSGDQNEASIQARFCKAVTELQITGLVRMPSKRRSDFVQRVAFGL